MRFGLILNVDIVYIICRYVDISIRKKEQGLESNLILSEKKPKIELKIIDQYFFITHFVILKILLLLFFSNVPIWLYLHILVYP